MPEAVIFTGIQASGKSTFYKERFFQTHVRVSLYLLRTRNREKKLIQYCLDTEMNFVVDNTNPSLQDRRRYFEFVSGYPQFKVIGYYFESTLEQCITRNNNRTGKERIPDIGIRSTWSKLEIPVLSEGYESLWQVRTAQRSGFEVEVFNNEI